MMRWVVSLLLLSAGILKGVEVVFDPSATLISPIGRWLLPLQVGVELGVGLLALHGWRWAQVKWIAVLLFIAFAGYSLYLVNIGQTSCECFGSVRIHPWWTFALDSAVVLGLLIANVESIRVTRHGDLATREFAMITPGGQPTNSPRGFEGGKQCGQEHMHPAGRKQFLIPAAMAISILTTVLLVRYLSHQTSAAEGVLPVAGGLVILEPEKWIGSSFPIVDFVNVDLSQGDWTVLLHSHNCPDCRAAVPRYEQMALTGTKVALVEVPPFGVRQPPRTECYYGRLTGDREWFVQTPVEIKLRDGVVVSAAIGKENADHH